MKIDPREKTLLQIVHDLNSSVRNFEIVERLMNEGPARTVDSLELLAVSLDRLRRTRELAVNALDPELKGESKPENGVSNS